MTDQISRQWIYARPIEGALQTAHFAYREVPIPQLRQGQALIRTRLISIDPANRLYFAMQSYRPQLQLGDVMAGFGIGEVVASTDPRFRVGDLWHGDFGWQDYAVLNSYDRSEFIYRCTPGESPEDLLGVYGITGLTAWFGVEQVGNLQPGQTVVVAGASGACGILIAQLAKLAGCLVIGIAGGPANCARLEAEFGLDATVDYRAPDMAARIAAACPGGVDFFSDGVGGEVSRTVLPLLKPGAGWYHPGNLSDYDHIIPGKPIPRNDAFLTPELRALCKERRLRPAFLLVFDHYCRRAEAEAILRDHLRAGRLQAPTTTLEGFANLPRALVEGAFGQVRTKFGKLNLRP